MAQVAVGLLAFSTVFVRTSVPGVAYDINAAQVTDQTIFYKTAASFPSYMINALYAGEQAWKVQGQGSLYQFYNLQSSNSTNYVHMVYIDGNSEFGGGLYADTNGFIPCPNSTASCWMHFDSAEDWYWNFGSTSNLDMWSTSAHEFGHWLGLEHTEDIAASHPNTAPTMSPTWPYGDVGNRDISQDDANGFLHRWYSKPTIANRSVEYDSPFLGFKFRNAPNGVGWNRYAGGADNGTYFIGWNGNGSTGTSISQDISHDHEFNSCGAGRVRARNINGAPVQVTIALWNVLAGTNTSQVYTLPANSGWVTLTTSGSICTAGHPNRILRLEVYNGSTWNVDVDSFAIV